MRLTGTDTLSVVALPEKTVDTTDWECETGLGGAPGMMSVCAGMNGEAETRRFGWEKTRPTTAFDGQGCAMVKGDSRLRAALGARGLAARCLATSHFCGWIRVGWGMWLGCWSRETA